MESSFPFGPKHTPRQVLNPSKSACVRRGDPDGQRSEIGTRIQRVPNHVVRLRSYSSVLDDIRTSKRTRRRGSLDGTTPDVRTLETCLPPCRVAAGGSGARRHVVHIQTDGSGTFNPVELALLWEYIDVTTVSQTAGPVDTATARGCRTMLRGWRPTGHPSRVASGLVGCEPRTSACDVRVKTIVDSRVLARAPRHSSRCSIPFFETFASVISLGIQSGLSSGAVSRHAQPS